MKYNYTINITILTPLSISTLKQFRSTHFYMNNYSEITS